MLRRGLQDRKIPRRMLGWIFDLAPLSRHCQLTAPLRSSFSLFTLLPRFRKTRRIFIFLVAELNNFFSTNFFLSLFLLLNQFLEIRYQRQIFNSEFVLFGLRNKTGGEKLDIFPRNENKFHSHLLIGKKSLGERSKTAFSWSNNSVN